ncbi:hypothetical protein BJV77DRAFT_375337 [Russula vinacea]|nr:hypothetical protein BJV77DRAFT_375337 [Russula vinacea]
MHGLMHRRSVTINPRNNPSSLPRILPHFNHAVPERCWSCRAALRSCLDHRDEIRLIWAAPRSFLKWIFLLNHYLSEVCLIVTANEMSGLTELSYDDHMPEIDDHTSRLWYLFHFRIQRTRFSRVIVIWDKSPRVVLGLSIALTATFLATMLCTIATIIILAPTSIIINYQNLLSHEVDPGVYCPLGCSSGL